VEDVVIRRVVVALSTLVGVALLVLAWQVDAWHDRMTADDVRFQVAPAAARVWQAPGGPAAGGARRLLGLDDDLRFRAAERQFVLVHVPARTYADEAKRLAAFGEAQSELEELARSDPAAGRRSRAANLLGILLWENAESAQENAPLLLRQSVAAFRHAIDASPTSDDAKYNLEVLLTVLEPTGERRRDAPEDAGGSGLRGAGIAAPGRGY
jgi:hypothetical protein